MAKDDQRGQNTAKDDKIRQKTPKYGKTTKYDKRQQTALVSVLVFFQTIAIFPSLLIPYHAWVSKRSATPVLLDCLCMDFCHRLGGSPNLLYKPMR